MKRLLISFNILLSLSVYANAELIDRGGGLIYDSDLNITWLQNANYSMTSGYDVDGRMSWIEAMLWADSLVYQGYDDWRLPATYRPDSNCSLQSPRSHGYNCSNNEMGHLYYSELRNSAGSLTNAGSFINFQDYWYYSMTQYDLDSDFAWGFSFLDIPNSPINESGWQATPLKNGNSFAMAVRNGDSIPLVPEPISSILFITGGGVVGFRRWFRKR